MGAEKNGVSPSTEGQAASLSASPHLGDCRARTLAYAGRLPGALCEAIEKDLSERVANVFVHAEDNAQLVDGLRVILKNKARLVEEFPGRVKHYFDQRLQPDMKAASPRGGADAGASLSLVDDSELEESLAITTLSGKLQERYSEDLYGLEQRFGELLSGPPLDRNRLPVGPDSFCHAFRDIIATLMLEPGAKVASYKLFEQVLLPGLGDFYAELNGFLIEKGVQPQLKARIRTQGQPSAPHNVGPAAGHRAPASGGGAGRGPGAVAAHESAPDEGFWGETVAPVQDEMYQAMQYLLGGHAAAGGSSQGTGSMVAGGGLYLPVTPMLVDTLSSLQNDPSLMERSGELLRGGLKQHVIGRFETMDSLGRPGIINQIDDETIDVISMIFDYILDDKTLPDFIKALIGRLQIPVLKVAIVDREFFTDKGHPARQLLNELAYAGMGWTEESEAAKDRLYEKMEATVGRILTEFGSDVKIFAELLGDFRDFLAEEKKNFALAQERIGIQAQEGGEVERVRLRIAEEIAARLANRAVPAEVRDFLVTVWRQLLTTLQMEAGEEAPARTRALQVMDDLIWSVEPKTNTEQRRRLGVLLPILLEELREGQLRIGRSEDDVRDFAAILERHHFTSLKTGRPRNEGKDMGGQDMPAAAPAQPQQGTPDKARLDEIDRMFRELSGDIEQLPEVDMEDLTDFDDLIGNKDPERQGSFEKMMAEMGFEADTDAGPRIEDKYTALVRSLELGTWVELDEPDGRKIRVKLAWVGDAYTNYSFVNRQYKVVAERPMYVLAGEFRTGTARLIEDVALFDRALDGVISGIMKFARPRAKAGHA